LFSDADLAQLASAGIGRDEAERQLALLRRPPPPARLARPATAGDGVLRLDDDRVDELASVGAAARDAGRVTKFVPASGAATRMFRELVAWRAREQDLTLATLRRQDDETARAVAAFVDSLPRLALAEAIGDALGTAPAALVPAQENGSLAPLLAALLDPAGLDAARQPKALLPFHRAEDGVRSAFVEQLFEGLGYALDSRGVARFHFTVPPGWRERFEAELGTAAARLPRDVRLEVGFSEQSSATDTLALEADGRPARTRDGRLLLRPSGHGALLENLASTGADLALVKNIDNVLPEPRHAEIARWQLALLGLLVEHEGTGDRSRPLRVAAVVPNAGEPGGGPFWVVGAEGAESLQIVEASQVESTRADQAAIWRASTHFNPVDLAVTLRSPDGRPYRLADFVDPATAFVSRKSEGGREITALERPGLWNGAMARWRTIFVELPLWTFAPVKSVVDLARPEHAAR
jgi:hypothetical protein